MKCVEINPANNFDAWEHSKVQELKKRKFDDRLGQTLLFENDSIKVWEVVLFPGEGLPFRKITRTYNIMSMTEGMAVSRYEDGKITMLRIKKGDSMFMRHEGRASVYDLENIGSNILFLHAIEFKPIVEPSKGLKVEP